MEQYWKVIAPEKEVYFDWEVYELGELLFNDAPEHLIMHLAVPIADLVESELSSVPLAFPQNSSSLVNLPTELLEEIISSLPFKSLFSLATCSQRLFYICRNRIVSVLKSQCGRLAGTSLICVGDYLAPDDYPPGIDWRSAMEERQKMYQKWARIYGHSDSEGPEMENLYYLAASFLPPRDPNGFAPIGTMSCENFREFVKFYIRLPRANREDLDFLINFDHHKFYPKGPEWVLRNLTTKEFVRRSVVAHGTNGPFSSGGVGLGEVLLSRICWSTDPNTAMSWDGIHRGIWAGHKFDITLMEALEGEVGWKDVSESAHEEIKGIWESEYGEKWEQMWRGK